MSRRKPLLAVTMGDPAGIGALVIVRALAELPELVATHRVVVIGALAELERAASRLELPWSPHVFDDEEVERFESEEVALIEPEQGTWSLATPGEPSEEGGRFQLRAIDRAIELTQQGVADAIVTGPVSKIAITEAGFSFGGHTEHLARAAGLAPEMVTMLFAGQALNIALVTTHHPLVEVSSVLSVDRVAQTILRVVRAFRRWWRCERPRVVVLGLNPHAGEGGLFGREEIDVIGPAIEVARSHEDARDALISGPIPSEAGIRRAVAGDFDCVIAHYHDQATIPSKLLDMGRAVNVTLGLPFLRTSVDHGVAYDAAKTGAIDAGSMVAALRLAARLT